MNCSRLKSRNLNILRTFIGVLPLGHNQLLHVFQVRYYGLAVYKGWSFLLLGQGGNREGC